MIQRHTFLLAFLLLAAAPLSAQDYAVFDFLRIPMNARAAALGNSFLTMRNDPAAIFANPANISTLETPAASLGFMKHLLDVNAGYIAYGTKLGSAGSIGGGITYMNFGSFDQTDRFGEVLGTFSAGDLAMSVGYSSQYENLHYGASVKFIYEYISEYNASGIALDAGVSYYFPEQEVVLALSALNLGTQLSSMGEDNEPLPLDIGFGASTKLEHLPLLLLLNFHRLNEQQDSFIDRFAAFSVGGEFILSTVVRLRLGYQNDVRDQLTLNNSAKLAGFSAGLGFNISGVLLDYAFSSMGEIGALHRISLGTAF